ncbi:unnamed protein product [Amoebophrya sp. A120]|nr:unnamed protein product [Amoebophrya sp. A120]|eukprot:GSA120T00006999001.1
MAQTDFADSESGPPTQQVGGACEQGRITSETTSAGANSSQLRQELVHHGNRISQQEQLVQPPGRGLADGQTFYSLSQATGEQIKQFPGVAPRPAEPSSPEQAFYFPPQSQSGGHFVPDDFRYPANVPASISPSGPHVTTTPTRRGPYVDELQQVVRNNEQNNDIPCSGTILSKNYPPGPAPAPALPNTRTPPPRKHSGLSLASWGREISGNTQSSGSSGGAGGAVSYASIQNRIMQTQLDELHAKHVAKLKAANTDLQQLLEQERAAFAEGLVQARAEAGKVHEDELRLLREQVQAFKTDKEKRAHAAAFVKAFAEDGTESAEPISEETALTALQLHLEDKAAKVAQREVELETKLLFLKKQELHKDGSSTRTEQPDGISHGSDQVDLDVQQHVLLEQQRQQLVELKVKSEIESLQFFKEVIACCEYRRGWVRTPEDLWLPVFVNETQVLQPFTEPHQRSSIAGGGGRLGGSCTAVNTTTRSRAGPQQEDPNKDNVVAQLPASTAPSTSSAASQAVAAQTLDTFNSLWSKLKQNMQSVDEGTISLEEDDFPVAENHFDSTSGRGSLSPLSE